MTREEAIQDPILFMGLQEIPAGNWGWTKGWPHLEHTAEEKAQIASHPTNYYLEEKGQWLTQEGKTILPREQAKESFGQMHKWTDSFRG